MARPFASGKVDLAGYLVLTTSTLASADIEFVNVTGSHHWGGCGASGVGDQTLEEEESLQQRGVHFYQQRVRLGYLDKQRC
jgi:hypothetical protein